MDSREDYTELAYAIIAQAYVDVNEIYEKVINVRNQCIKGELKQYIQNLRNKHKNNRHGYMSQRLPFFTGDDDYTAMEFFSLDNEWGQTLLNHVDVYHNFPEIKHKLEAIRSYSKHCVNCVDDLIIDSYKSKDVLSAPQMRLLEFFREHGNTRLTIKKRCQLAGISQGSYRTAFKNSYFIEIYNSIMEGFADERKPKCG